MPKRRDILRGAGALLASVAAPSLGWADAGSPVLLAAARDPDGRFALYGLTDRLAVAFRVPLPDRGHAATAHPTRPEAVAFARRPGTFALVLDCATGRVHHSLTAPKGRHFYGHGAYLAGGDVLVTTENAYDSGEGRLGLWDATDGYRRMGEIASGGIGPHEVLRLPGAEILVVANGGIRTHPASDREMLNRGTMRPNLTYIRDGAIIEQVELPADLHQASIRHLAARPDGTVAAALQWEGPADRVVPLLALHRRGGSLDLRAAETEMQRRLDGYAGSVAWSGDGSRVAITSPRGGLAQIHAAGGEIEVLTRPDICGVAPFGAGFTFTDGLGGLIAPERTARIPVAWDNHLIAIA